MIPSDNLGLWIFIDTLIKSLVNPDPGFKKWCSLMSGLQTWSLDDHYWEHNHWMIITYCKHNHWMIITENTIIRWSRLLIIISGCLTTDYSHWMIKTPDTNHWFIKTSYPIIGCSSQDHDHWKFDPDPDHRVIKDTWSWSQGDLDSWLWS